MSEGYYRHPALHADQVIFVCEDDLWTVPTAGGVARRLTAGEGIASFPTLSPDGKRVAFTSNRDGSPEVYVMRAAGGVAERISYTGALLTQTVNWTPDGKRVLFASEWGQPFRGPVRLHQASPDGGPIEVLPYGPARAIAFQPKGKGKGVVIGINTGDPARWKRYRGGTAGTLWIDREGNGSFAPLVQLEGNLAGPMWVGSRIYFLSDHEGHGNLYSCTPTGRSLRRHTDHEDYYVRFPSTDGRRIVYHAGADLFLFDPKTDRTERIGVEFQSPRIGRSRKFVDAAEYLETAAVHPEGKGIVCVARGASFTMPLWEGAPRRHDEGSGSRHRLSCWLPGGKAFACVADDGGEEALVIVPVQGRGRRRKVPGNVGRVLEMVPAPAGPTRLALSNHRQELWIASARGGRPKRIAKSAFDRIAGFAWSPDGRYLAYALPVSHSATALHIHDTRSGKSHAVTRGDFRDFRPAFDPEGRYLYFLSHRVYDPVYDNQLFDLGFPMGVRPYLIPLRKDTPSPFSAAHRTPQPPRGVAEEEEKDTKRKTSASIRIDFGGIAERVVAFPVPEGRYLRIDGTKGRVYFTSVLPEGSLNDNWAETGPAAKATLEYWDFDLQKTDLLVDGVSDFSLSLDRKTILIRVANDLRALASSQDPKEMVSKDVYGREAGWIDLGRLRVEVTPENEWGQMFREAWRLQRDQFWTDNMSHVDWKDVHKRYLPLVDRVATRSEFSDLLWEMQGELGTSHCYELGGDYKPRPAWLQGMLGADLNFDRRRKRWRVGRIPQGDSWDNGFASPLAAPGLDVKAGDEILEVDGVAVDAQKSPHACLVNQVHRDVVLTVSRPSRNGKAPKVRHVTVRTLGSESMLRYRDWVSRNREWVHRKSKGRVGYVHIPNMGPFGYSEFHRAFPHEAERDGLIVDVRFNGGGHVSSLILEKLARRRVGYDVSRWQGRYPYPPESPTGPMVALTNEYAGSDGDIFSHCFKLYGLGPLIGKRTWGGVVGIWPRHALVDGTLTTQPEFSFWFKDVGFDVENYGTDPDIDVDIKPQDHAKGRDTQLERGLQEILKILKESPPQKPKLDPLPNLKPPRLKKPTRRG